ncbi:MAG TPA: hypothetical protein PKY10_03715, partial [Lentisphaeria bacterium]|nr:hypothetical protein [Lentisphaeria bacterium]
LDGRVARSMFPANCPSGALGCALTHYFVDPLAGFDDVFSTCFLPVAAYSSGRRCFLRQNDICAMIKNARQRRRKTAGSTRRSMFLYLAVSDRSFTDDQRIRGIDRERDSGK